MKKLLVIGIVVVVLVGILLLLVFNLGAIVNRNKDALITRAEQQLGREITIGEIGVKLWGGLGVRLDDFTVADDPAFSDEPFVRARSLQVDVQILPLLRKELKIKRITLHDPVIRVIRGEGGTLNTGPAAAAPEKAGTVGEESRAAPLAISLVNVTGGDLTYIDRVRNLGLHVTHIESKVAGVQFSKPIDVEIEAAIFGEASNLRLAGSFGPLGQTVDPAAIPIDATFALENISVEAVTAAFPSARSSFPPDLSMAGPVSVDGSVSGTSSKLHIAAEIDGTSLVLSRSDKFNKPAGTSLVLSVHADYAGTTLVLGESTLRFHELRATTSGACELGDSPTLDLHIRTEPVPLSGWEGLIPAAGGLGLTGTFRFDGVIAGTLRPGEVPRIAGTALLEDAGARPPQAFKPLTAVNGKVELLGNGAAIDHASVTIGATTFDATARVESFAPLRVKYKASSSAITLDDFRPPNPKAKKPEVLKSASVEGVIDGARHTGSLSSSGGSVANVDYKNLSGKYAITGKEAKLSDIHMQTLDGTIDGAGTVILDRESPSFAFDAKVRGVNVVDLFDMIPGTARKLISGKANLDLTVAGKGKEWANIQKNLDGNGLAELLDGAFLDFNVLKGVLDQLGQRTGQQQWISQSVVNKYPKVFKDPDTKFDKMKSDFVIQGGRLKARNLTLDAGDYGVLGQGSIGFDNTVDLKVTMKLSPALSKDLIADVREAKYLANTQGLIEVPFVLSGTLPKVTPGIDSKFIGEVIQRALLQKGGDTIQKKLLDGLFGGKKTSAPPDTTSKPGG